MSLSGHKETKYIMVGAVGREGNRAVFLKFDLKIKNEMKISFRNNLYINDDKRHKKKRFIQINRLR